MITETGSDETVVGTSAAMSIEELSELLETTDAVEQYPFDFGNDDSAQVELSLDDPIDKLHLTFGELRYALTRASAEQLFKQVKMPSSLLDDVPLELTVPVLNWYLRNKSGSLKALLVNTGNGKKIAAFCRIGTAVYSSVEMLETVLKTIEQSYGAKIAVATNVLHELHFTTYTLLFQDTAEVIDGTGEVLVSGLTVQHSITGDKPTLLLGATGRDYNFNAMVSLDRSAQWNRKQAKRVDLDEVEDDSDAYDLFSWLEDNVKDIWSTRRNDTVSVGRLYGIRLDGHSGEFLSDVFAKYSIPVGAQNEIRLQFAEQEEPSIYGLWNAITATAQHPEFEEKPTLVRKLMTVGGELAKHPESCPSCHRLKDLA